VFDDNSLEREPVGGTARERRHSTESDDDGHSAAIPAGEVLDGRFRIVREIAQGGMGVVYEAFDQRLNRRIALKLAKARHGFRLTPEVRHASEISHPNVCRIFEIHTARTPRGEVDFITMEFVEGETLKQRLRNGPLPNAEARAIALQLCAGVAEAHRKGVIHRDLKPSNVILSRETDGVRAVITDFGLAGSPEAALEAAKLGVVSGTPAYMAPELWKGQPASVAADIFALGVILYEMASGRMPHAAPSVHAEASTATIPHGSDPRAQWEQRLRNGLPPVSPQWDRILGRCLELDPAKRFSNVEEIATALGPSRTRRRMLAAAAAAVLMLVTGVITYERSIAPKEKVALAILPVETDSSNAAFAPTLMHEAERKLAEISSGPRIRFALVKTGATHALRVALENHPGTPEGGDRITLRALVTDTRTQANLREWSADYARADLRFAPQALAGVVTWTFALPAVPEGAKMRDQAREAYEAGLASLRKGSQVDAALAAFERAVAADPDSALTWVGLAEAQWFKYSGSDQRAWYDRTEDSLRRAQSRNPDLARVHSVAGLLKGDHGWYDQAIAEYRRALELDPQFAVNYRRMGQALERNSQAEDALAAFKRAIELDPGDYRNYVSLAAHWNARGNLAAGLENYVKAAERAPKEPIVHYALGVQYQALGRFAEAERALAHALELQEIPQALHALGVVLYYEGRCREAIPYVQRSVQRNPIYLGWLQMGICYGLLAEPANARAAFRKGLAMAESEVAQNPRSGRDRAFLAYFCAQTGDRRRAESEAAQALQLSPQDVNAREAVVWTQEVLGQRAASLRMAAGFSADMLAELNRRPELKSLREDPQFLRLLVSHQIK
jgi:tetratricopeptide (TPR) repeat protein